jgi:predicted peroxiredoxin
MKHLLLLSMMFIHQFSFSQNIKPDTLDFKGKTITAYVLSNTIQALKSKQVGESVILKTDNLKALENDLMSWSRMTSWPLSLESNQPSNFVFKITKGQPINHTKKLAIVISKNGLEELLSPLGLAICCGLSGYDVNIYFQGPSVRILTKEFKEKLPSFNSIFSGFARNGLNKVGHLPAQQKLRTLQELGAKFYVCQPSMQHFGVREKDLVFNDLILCEYLTFLEVYNTADLKLFLQ